MNKIFLNVIICIIAGVALYFLTPFVHYLLRWPSRFFIISILIYFVISIVIGIITAIKPFEREKAIPYFFIPITLAVSILPHHILSQGNYDKQSGHIIYRYDTSEFGVVDKWGKTVVPKSDFESLFLALNGKFDRFLVGVKYNGLDEKRVYEIRDIYVYKLKDGHYDPLVLYRIKCDALEREQESLLSFIKKNVGFPMMGETDFMSILSENYVKETDKLELKDEIQIGYIESKQEDTKESNNEYEDLGEVEVWFYGGSDISSKKLMLRVKSVNNENFYYLDENGKKLLVTRTKYCMEGDWNNAKAGEYYFNNPAWPLIKEDPDPDPDPSPSPDPSPDPTPTPQPKQLQPVSVWVPCMTCNNSGQCQRCYGQGWTYSSRAYDGKQQCFNCGGSGKCTTCAGQGGHNEVQYR